MLRTSLIAIRPRRPALSCRTSPERPTSHRDNPNIFGTREYNFFFKQLQTDPHKNVIEKILFSLRKRTARVKGARSPSSQLFFANYLFSAKRNSGGQGGAATLVSAFLCERSFLCEKKQRGSRGCGPPDLSFPFDLFSAKRNSGDQGGAATLVSAFLCLLSFLCEKKVSQWRERGLRLECRSPSERLGSFAPGTGSGS